MSKNRTMIVWLNRFGLVGVAGIVIIILFLILFPPNPINHDCAYFLQAALMLSQGSIPYVDYIGMNPPLADYIHLFPVMLYRLLNLSLVFSFYIFIGLLVFSMTFTFWKLLRSSSLISSNPIIYLLIMGYLCLSLYMFSWGNFGQREHLFVLFLIPYLFLRGSRIQQDNMPSWIPYVIGIFASVIFLLKPHFLFVVFMAELWLILRTRSLSNLWKPEIVLLIGIGLLYGLHFLIIPDAMKQAFFNRWMPFVAKHYDVYDLPARSLVLPFPLVSTVLIILYLIILYGFVSKLIHRKIFLVEIFILAAGMSHAMMVIQKKGWPYHRFPFIALLCYSFLILLMLIFEMMKGRKTQFHNDFSSVIWIGVFLFICIETVRLVFQSYIPRYEWMQNFIECIQENSDNNDRIAVLSTSMNPAYPTLLYADRLPGTRYVTSFPIAMFYEGVQVNPDSTFPYRSPDLWVPEERQFLKELGEDITTLKPKMVIIHAEKRNYGAPWGFIINDYLNFTGWTDQYMQGYRFLKKIKIERGTIEEIYNVYIKNNHLSFKS